MERRDIDVQGSVVTRRAGTGDSIRFSQGGDAHVQPATHPALLASINNTTLQCPRTPGDRLPTPPQGQRIPVPLNCIANHAALYRRRHVWSATCHIRQVDIAAGSGQDVQENRRNTDANVCNQPHHSTGPGPRSEHSATLMGFRLLISFFPRLGPSHCPPEWMP